MITIKNPQVGQISPSHLLFTYGVGAIVDLPQISVIVTGLEDWPSDASVAREIVEVRLLRAVRAELGHKVAKLLAPPVVDEQGPRPDPFGEQARLGVPVATFPRWMVCPACRLLSPIKSGLFELKPNPFHPDRTHYEHVNCNKPGRRPTVVPARFLVACENGHLDDFPWIEFVHKAGACSAPVLRLSEYGASGEARDLEVHCDTCGAKRRMAEAFGKENRAKLPECRGRRPHLRDYDPAGCKDEDGQPRRMRTITLGASNAWFPIALATIALPESTDKLDLLVEEQWVTLKNVVSQEVLTAFRNTPLMGAVAGIADGDLLAAIQRKRSREQAADQDAGDEGANGVDLKLPEWNMLSQPDTVHNSHDFMVKRVTPPARYAEHIAGVLLVERLREVRALIGFTRIDSPGELGEPGMEELEIKAPLTRQPPVWVPAVEVRGEGIFLRFDEAKIQKWLSQAQVKARDAAFFDAHVQWREARHIQPPQAHYPGLRYVLLHTLAHALMRQFALECGYTAASIRERIYARDSDQPGGPMAGVLLYTAAPDSEGTLGGLVSLGEPQVLGRHLGAALEAAELCASDPTCAEHQPGPAGIAVHAAACHACLFAPETSCERGNRYLDRSLLVPTVEREDLAFWGKS